MINPRPFMLEHKHVERIPEAWYEDTESPFATAKIYRDDEGVLMVYEETLLWAVFDRNFKEHDFDNEVEALDFYRKEMEAWSCRLEVD